MENKFILTEKRDFGTFEFKCEKDFNEYRGLKINSAYFNNVEIFNLKEENNFKIGVNISFSAKRDDIYSVYLNKEIFQKIKEICNYDKKIKNLDTASVSLGKENIRIVKECYCEKEDYLKEKHIKDFREKYKEQWEQAKKENKDIEIFSYSCPCNDKREECNLDIVTEYITPDGKYKEERQHTW
ncbi:MAG: hypothetical protein ACRC2K_13435 [Clostridium sp.]